MKKHEDYIFPKHNKKLSTEITKLPEDDFSFTENTSVETASSVDWEDKFKKLKAMIMPLLNNLSKDPHKDIHWPDRDKKIQEFKKKIQEL